MSSIEADDDIKAYCRYDSGDWFARGDKTGCFGLCCLAIYRAMKSKKYWKDMLPGGLTVWSIDEVIEQAERTPHP